MANNTPPGFPRWVKFLIGAGVLILLAVAALGIFGGGEHGPDRHAPTPGNHTGH